QLRRLRPVIVDDEIGAGAGEFFGNGAANAAAAAGDHGDLTFEIDGFHGAGSTGPNTGRATGKFEMAHPFRPALSRLPEPVRLRRPGLWRQSQAAASPPTVPRSQN